MKIRLLAVLLAAVLSAHASFAACINRFVVRSEKERQVVTLLTGKYTFQEAQAMAGSAKLEWVDEAGKVVARQLGDLKVVRPMPVGCDGKTSGVVMVATFLSLRPPSKKMIIRFDANTTVTFDEQTN